VESKNQAALKARISSAGVIVIHSYANGHNNSYANGDADTNTNKPAQINPDIEATADSAASPIGSNAKTIAPELARKPREFPA
jgi:hypothetical protein